MSIEEAADIKCRRCKSYRYPKDFLNTKGRQMKCCQKCRDRCREWNKNKKCVCKKSRPLFGFESDKKATCCSSCKDNNMIDIKNPRCICGKSQPSFGFEGDKKAASCSSCKEDGMVDIKHPRCKTPMCDILINRKYRGYCSRCFFFTFPNEKLTRNYKTKENLMVAYVQNKYPDFDWLCDMRISDGCSLRRPDMVADFGSHVIVIECDENRHNGYSCEIKRMMEILKDVGMRPTIFLRFNPDSYIDKSGIKHSSCFVVKKDTGKLEIKSPNVWKKRLDELCKKLEYYSVDRDYKIFNVDQLFYD